MVSPPHRDLLAIIFAYAGLSRRRILSNISRQSRAICRSYHYIISVRKNNPMYMIDELLFLGIHNNDTEIISILLKNPLIDPSASKNSAIIQASRYGHPDVVRLLLADPRVNPGDGENKAIIWASISGHLEVIRLLLSDPRVNPGDNGSESIYYAVRDGKFEVVKLLLSDPRVNPTCRNNNIIEMAFREGHSQIGAYLLEDKRVRNSLFPWELEKYEILINTSLAN